MAYEPGPINTAPSLVQDEFDLVEGLRLWCLSAAPAPMNEAALIFALSTVGGIAARSYNISNSGLNQFWYLMGKSGSGKGIIAKCRRKLFSSVAVKVSDIMDFKGTSYCASAPAQIKFLARKRHPVAITDIDEFAHDLAQMNNPKNDNMQAKQKFYLEIWDRGGAGNEFDPLVYSDAEKNVAALISPALTLVGVSTTQKGDEVVNGKLASSGFLARENVIRYEGDIAAYNVDHEQNFETVPPELVSGIGDLVREAVRLANAVEVRRIKVEPEASEHFTRYAEGLRLRRNAMSDFASDLLNRNHEKAMRTAGAWAVGRNIYDPVVTRKIAEWATDFIDLHANKLLAKMENGEVGEEAGNQAKQRTVISRLINEFLSQAFDKSKAYGQTDKMHKAQIVTHSYLQKRVFTLPSFKPKPTQSLTDIMKTFLDAHELQEVPVQQMQQELDTRAKAYKVVSRSAFDLPCYFGD